MSDEIKNNVEETVINEDTVSGVLEVGEIKEGEKMYTQDEINEIIKNRLAREKKKQDDALKRAADEAENQRLAEQEQYKELYEKLQREINESKERELKSKKEALLTKAGYKDEQISKFLKYVEGETDEELALSVNELIQDIPPKTVGVDPSMKNPPSHKPAQKDGYEESREILRGLLKRKK